MGTINSQDVAALRQKTGLGMMDCKKALEATEGDFEQAIDYLRKKGVAKGEARSDRKMGEGVIESYIHAGSRLGVLVEINCETDFVARSKDFLEMTHNIALQIAAAAPLYVNREEVPQEKIDRELEIYREQMKDQNKPPEILEKIVTGKLEKFFKESCLIEQTFIKNPDVIVKDMVLSVAGKLKENIQVSRFSRFSLGE